MAAVGKIDSNSTLLRFAEETSLGTLSGSPTFYEMEPNSYSDFGPSVTLVPRVPINQSRQRKKGVLTDLDASGGFNTDLTQTNLERLMRGFMFANWREKAKTKSDYGNGTTVTLTSTTTSAYVSSAGNLGIFRVGDLVFASGFTNTENNGLKRITAVTTDGAGGSPDSVTVAETLVVETPPAAAKLVHVGFQFSAGDLDVTTSGAFATYTTTTKDLTQFGLIPGEMIFVGDSTTSLMKFTNAANNGFKRVRSVTANALVVDKSESAMVTEASTSETVRIFFGRVLKNESDPTNIVRYTYQLERQLGYSDTADTTLKQAEYLKGAVPNEFTIRIPSADKVMVDLSFVAKDHDTIDENTTGADTLRSEAAGATVIPVVEADAFNTSSNVPNITMHVVSSTAEAPAPLFSFVQSLELTINNNVTPLKAVGTLGAFEMNAGLFAVSANATVYFNDVDAMATIRQNSDVTMAFHLYKANAGMSFDLPLIAVGDGRPAVASDTPVTLPLTNEAASGAKVLSTMNHTLLIVSYDYLPSLAE